MRALAGTLRALIADRRRHPGQLAALLAGLFLASALWCGVQAINAEARASYAEAAGRLSAGARIEAASGGRLDDAAFVTLRLGGWRVAPLLEGEVETSLGRLKLIGIDPVSGARGGGAAPEGALDALLGDPQGALAAPDLAAAGEVSIGGAILPLTEACDAPEGAFLVDIGLAQRLLDAPGQLSALLAPEGRAPDAATLDRLGLVLARAAPQADLARLTDSFHLNLSAFALLAFVVGALIAHAAAGLSFERRLPLFRALRACGVSARGLGAALALEMGALALIAALAGAAAGWAIALALMPGVAATLGGLYGAAVPNAPALRAEWVLSGLALTLGAAALASASGVARAAGGGALAALRPASWARAEKRRIAAQASAAALAAFCALALAQWGEGLRAGLALLACLLLAAALILPALLAGMTWISGRLARAPLAQWAAADARQSLSGLSLALMALLLALAANIGVGAMVGGFRHAFEGWIEQRLFADIYLRLDDAQQAALEDMTLPGLAAILPSRAAKITLEGAPVEALSFEDHPRLRATWPLISLAESGWEEWRAGRAAMISEQLSRRRNLGPGDPLGVSGLIVGGVHPDYGNPLGQIMLPNTVHARLFPEGARDGTGVLSEPGRRAELLEALRAAPELAGARIADQAAVKAQAHAVFERTFAVTGALNALTFAAAGAALFIALATLADQRLSRIAPVWALGATRARLAGLELAQMLGLALGVAVLAIPLGLALSWALVAVVNVRAFGWRLPYELFPADWLRLGALALLTAGLAAAPGARRLMRQPPARLLAAFGAER